MGAKKLQTRSHIFLVQQENQHDRGVNRWQKTALRMERLAKHSHVLLLPRKIPQKTPTKKILVCDGQRRIPQNQPNTRTPQKTRPQNKSRIHPNILTRTKPHRNLLENHKKQRHKLNILHHTTKTNARNRQIQPKTFF